VQRNATQCNAPLDTAFLDCETWAKVSDVLISVCPKTLENGHRVPISFGKVPVFGPKRGVHLPEVNSGLDERGVFGQALIIGEIGVVLEKTTQFPEKSTFSIVERAALDLFLVGCVLIGCDNQQKTENTTIEGELPTCPNFR